MTSNTGPILVFPRIQPFGSEDFPSLGKVYSRQATDSVNYENSSESFVMKYCPHGVTVSHEEKEEEEVEQEVESDGEKTLKERCACPWMG